MKTRNTRARSLLTKALIQALVLNSLLGFVSSRAPVYAQSRPIVVTADQPNVWTLEQAHYLLQQMHHRNLDLKAKSLTDLDANEIAGVRLDVLKTLLEVGVAYNDANRVTNRLLSQNKTYNSERRQALTARRDQLHEESLALTREISALKQQQARAATQEEKDRLGADVETKTAERDAVDKEIEYTDGELKTLGDASGDFKETTPEVSFDEKRLPSGLLDDAAKDAFKKVIDNFNDAPKLNASLMLDNFLQMQYEIIAKQLTLLRDEV
ncbi:MAG: hypothetical protein ABR563_17435, partial [Pyrinomonadaceae bacterium]